MIGGSLLSTVLGISFGQTNFPREPVVGVIQELVGTTLFMAYWAFCVSWPAAFILLATLGLLRGYGSRWPGWQRWGLLLAGITVGALLLVLYTREAWSELIEVGFSWALVVCRPWILAAYIAIPWVNRKYLRSSLPPASPIPHAPAAPAVRV